MKKLLAYIHRYPQSVRFLIAGCLNTAVGYTLFLLLYALFYPRLDYLVILVLTYLISGVNGYASMRYIAFKDFKGPWWPGYLRSQLSYLGVLALNAVLLSLFIEMMHLWIPLAQLVATIICVCATYIAHKYFTFRA